MTFFVFSKIVTPQVCKFLVEECNVKTKKRWPEIFHILSIYVGEKDGEFHHPTAWKGRDARG